MSKKKYRVSIEVTYFVDILVSADDEDGSVIEIEKYLASCDDYDIVNRSKDRQVQIDKINRHYPKKG